MSITQINRQSFCTVHKRSLFFIAKKLVEKQFGKNLFVRFLLIEQRLFHLNVTELVGVVVNLFVEDIAMSDASAIIIFIVVVVVVNARGKDVADQVVQVRALSLHQSA